MAAVTILLAACFFCAGYLIGTKVRSKIGVTILLVSALVLAVPACLYGLYYVHFFDQMAWYYRLRISPFSELLAGGLGFLAGVGYAKWKPEGPWQGVAIPLALLGALSVPFLKSVLDPLDSSTLRADCPGEVCLQSTPSTCGPCSAASILKRYGHPISERELARESFTSHGGTEVWHLARALNRRGFRTEVVIQPTPNIEPPVPSVAGVILPGGAGHFIAVLSKDEKQFTLADPLRGLLVVRSELQSAYHFTGFFLSIQSRDRPL